MRLLLKVISYAGNPPDTPLSITLDHEIATIGRRAGNRWALPDPLRYLSGQHAIIEYRTPDYYLTDTSTNGVGINNAMLGKGHSQKLIEGDRLVMGEYIISVTLIQEQLDDSTDVPVPVLPVEVAAPSKPAVDDFFSPMNNDPRVSHNFAESTHEGADELFSDWPGAIDTQEVKANDSTPLDFPTFDSEQEQIPNSTLDNKPVSPLEEPFPENIFSPAVQPVVNDSVTDPFADWPGSSNIEINTPDIETPKTPEIPKVAVKEKEAPAQTVSTDDAKVNISPSSHPTNADLVQSFLQGAGLTDENIPTPLPAESFHVAGEIFRIAVQGMMDVLAARANIKNEMHMDATVIGSTRNNPIKFSRNADDAMITLLSSAGAGYMPPQQAIEETFDDIQAHQLAVFTGVQTALKSVLQRFNPDKLEQRLQKQSPISASIPVHKQAKLWRLFEELYDNIEREAEDDFSHLFGEAFAQAYEKQVEQLQQAKKESPMNSMKTK